MRIARLICSILLLPITSCVNHVLDDFECHDPLVVDTEVVTPNSSCAVANGILRIVINNHEQVSKVTVNGIVVDQYELTGLAGGKYLIAVTDRCGMLYESSVAIENINSDLEATADVTPNNDCFNPNGKAIIHVTGGTEPYFITYDDKILMSNTIKHLKDGVYTATIRDANGCAYGLAVNIGRTNTGISWSGDIAPIVSTYCAKSGCHVSGTGRVDFTMFKNVKTYALAIKERTRNKSMPYDGPLDDAKIRLIGCWVEDGALLN